MQVQAETGAPFEYIYNVARKMRKRGELERRKFHDDAQRKQIVAFIKANSKMPQYRIAQKFKVSQSYVSALCRDVHLGREKQTKERNTKMARAMALLAQDQSRSIASVAEEIGMNYSTLRHQLQGKITRNLLVTASIRQEVRAAIAEAIPELVAQLRQALKEGK